MKFRSLILKNIFLNKSRTFLAILGITVGIAAVIELGLVTDGLASSAQKAITAGAADFTLVSANSAGNQGGPDQMIESSVVVGTSIKHG